MEETVKTEGGVKRNLFAEYLGYLKSGLKRFFVNDWQIWVSFLAPCLIMIISYLVFYLMYYVVTYLLLLLLQIQLDFVLRIV